MNPNIPGIEQLKEITLPPPISYAPQTWGWWVLLAVLLGAAMLVGAQRYGQWRRDRYRREALLRLAQLQNSDDQLHALRELPELLKRVALSMPVGHRHHNGPGALGGADWQAFLARHSTQPIPAGFSLQMAQLAYSPDATLLALSPAQRQRLFNTCKHWVEHHHVAD